MLLIVSFINDRHHKIQIMDLTELEVGKVASGKNQLNGHQPAGCSLNSDCEHRLELNLKKAKEMHPLQVRHFKFSPTDFTIDSWTWLADGNGK